MDFPIGWNVEDLVKNKRELTIRTLQRDIETAISCQWVRLVVENRNRDSELDEIVQSLVPRGFQVSKMGRGKVHGGYAWCIEWKTIDVLRQEAEDVKRAVEERRREDAERVALFAARENLISYTGSTGSDLAGNYPV